MRCLEQACSFPYQMILALEIQCFCCNHTLTNSYPIKCLYYSMFLQLLLLTHTQKFCILRKNLLQSPLHETRLTISLFLQLLLNFSLVHLVLIFDLKYLVFVMLHVSSMLVVRKVVLMLLIDVPELHLSNHDSLIYCYH